MGILGVESGLDGVRGAELTAARPHGSGANLAAARGERWESPLAAETRVVAVSPCERTGDHDGLPCSIVACRVVVEGGDVVWAQVATIAAESSVGFPRYLHVRMHLVEIVQTNRADDDGGKLARERRLVHGRVVPLPCPHDGMDLDGEGAFYRRHGSHPSDQEPVGVTLHDSEALGQEVRDQCLLVSDGRGIERVERLLTEEAPVVR